MLLILVLETLNSESLCLHRVGFGLEESKKDVRLDSALPTIWDPALLEPEPLVLKFNRLPSLLLQFWTSPSKSFSWETSNFIKSPDVNVGVRQRDRVYHRTETHIHEHRLKNTPVCPNTLSNPLSSIYPSTHPSIIFLWLPLPLSGP